MVTKKDKFVVVRILETSRARFKVKAAKKRKKLYEIIEEVSHI
jgi:hypothetical protein